MINSKVKLFVFILCIYVPSLQAKGLGIGIVGLDIGIGGTRAEDPSNGLWHQEGFEHDIDTDSLSAHIGIRFNTAYEKLDLLVGYKYLGSFSSKAKASASDLNYKEWRGGESEIWPLSEWNGKGRSHGIYGIAEYSFSRFFVTGGVWLSKSSWSMDIPDWRCSTNASGACTADYPMATFSDPRPLSVKGDESSILGWVIGIGKTFGDFSITYEIWETRDESTFPAIYRGNSQNISLTYRVDLFH